MRVTFPISGRFFYAQIKKEKTALPFIFSIWNRFCRVELVIIHVFAFFMLRYK
jgi:hypothetical protein